MIPPKSGLLFGGGAIEDFLSEKLKLELHPQKYKIVNLSRGVDFVGFRNFYYFKLLRKRNIRNVLNKINVFSLGEISKKKMSEIIYGWNAYAKWANSYKLRKSILSRINSNQRNS